MKPAYPLEPPEVLAGYKLGDYLQRWCVVHVSQWSIVAWPDRLVINVVPVARASILKWAPKLWQGYPVEVATVAFISGMRA